MCPRSLKGGIILSEFKFIDGGIANVQGFKSTGIHSGLKKAKKDLAIIYSEAETAAAGVFTENKVKAAPVLVSKEHIEASNGYCNAIVINSANANACTGVKGMENAREMAKIAAGQLKLDVKEVLISSTGVIGVQLPMDIILEGIKKASKSLFNSNSSSDAAEAIMTTDTFPKEAAVEVEIGGKTVKMGGMAKGSGMIHPNMATMLSFVATDVSITPQLLKEALGEVVDETYNMISVDGDTSTNDMVLVLANACAGNEQITEKNSDYDAFKNALSALCYRLSELIVRDGEGATKFINVKVINAKSVEDARKAARCVTTSALVKTAIFGEDANWGRVIMAVGNSGANFDPGVVDMYIESKAGKEQMMENGMGLSFSEARAKAILEEKDIGLVVDMKLGSSEATAWTCDFSYDYVKINADYRS